MAAKRIHILSAVNAANVNKSGATYTIKNVCGAHDGIVLNRMLYPAEQLAAGVASLDGKPAPAGHPKDADGRYISALNGDALLKAYAGAVCRNARHEGGRTLVDIEVNEAQARAHPDGLKLVERLDAAIAGTNSAPIHVSTGLFCEPITANGESGGKAYDRVATRISYDHMAFLLHERGAGTPEQGVGMFLNADGEPEPVEEVQANAAPQDRRVEGFAGWLKKLFGNTDLSFDQISEGLYKQLPEGAWLREVFDRYAIFADRDGRLFRQDYTVSSDGSVAWSGTAVEVTRKVEYEPISNHEDDAMRDTILAALNKAGVHTAGKSDEQLLADYEAMKVKPHTDALTAANSKVAEFEAAQRAAADAELTALATELATNSALKPDDFKAMGLARCKELKAAGKGAAAVVPGGAGNKGASLADVFINHRLQHEAAAGASK